MAITQSIGQRTTDSTLSTLKFRDVQKEIIMIKPNRTPFLSLSLKLGTKETVALKFEFAQDDYLAKTVTISGAYINTDTTIQLATGHAARVKPNSQILNLAQSDIMRVTLVDTNLDKLTVVRSAGGTTAAGSVGTADVLIIASNGAGEEGTKVGTAISTNPDLLFNFVEEFETPIEMSWWQQVTEDFTEADWPRQVRKSAEEHKEAIETALWFGGREQVTAGALEGKKVLYTGGVNLFLTQQAPAANIVNLNGGVLTLSALQEWLEIQFRAGNPNRKTIFTTPFGKLVLIRLAQGNVETSSSEKTLGIEITKINVLGYTIPIITSQLFVDLGLTGVANTLFCLDMDYIKLRHLTGKGRTKVLSNIQENDRKSRKDAFHSILGLEMQNTNAHGKISNFIG